jgi:hypothetical protein
MNKSTERMVTKKTPDDRIGSSTVDPSTNNDQLRKLVDKESTKALIGLFVGLIIILTGVVLIILGISGVSDITITLSDNFTINLTNASSGIVIILIGFLVISATKFNLAHIHPKDEKKTEQVRR